MLGHKILSKFAFRTFSAPIEQKFYATRTTTKRQSKKTQKKKKKNGCTPEVLMNPQCKSAIITGGTSGIGFAAATKILAAGARRVVIVGRQICRGQERETLLNNTFGKNRAKFIQANLANVKKIDEAFKKSYDILKGIDIVVNAAGMIDGANWEKEIITNVIGTIRSTLLAYKYVGKEGTGKGGVIINISGKFGLEGFPEAPTYSASQHAILGLSRSFGAEQHVERSGLRVVTLCPGLTKTPMLKNLDCKGMTDVMGKELKAAAEKKKKQRPEACGDAVVHLVKYAESGTIWTVEGSRLFSVVLPPTKKCSTLAAQFM